MTPQLRIDQKRQILKIQKRHGSISVKPCLFLQFFYLRRKPNSVSTPMNSQPKPAP